MAFLKRFFAVTTVSLATLGGASAQPEVMLALDPEGFKEIMRDSALISGAVVTGAQSNGPAAKGDLILRGYLPPDWAGNKVCLSVLLINGFYEAAGTYSVPADWPGGLALLPFPSQHTDMLGAQVGDALGLRITHGACNSGQPDEVSLALSNRRSAEVVTVFLNSFRAEAAYLYVGDRDEPVLCVAIDAQTRTAFDMRCDLPMTDLSGKVPMEVYRVVERKVSPPTHFALWLPK